MIIIGCDFHTRYQQIAMANGETGELLLERRLDHESGEAQAFYRELRGPVRCGHRSDRSDSLVRAGCPRCQPLHLGILTLVARSKPFLSPIPPLNALEAPLRPATSAHSASLR